MATVRMQALEKRFGAVDAVKGVDLDIADHEFVVLVGPSGCGKSTILRMIAGLEDPSAGEIHIGADRVTHVPPKDRNIAMVFQNYALYPHMSVYRNMAFSLRARRMGRAEIDRRVRQAAAILELDALLDRRPAELSGGQRQRVAMGRAIVREPTVFLFDEPLSNLDAKLRHQMRAEIKKLHQRLRTTVIYVTHDQVEAMTLADRIVILKDGRIEQIGAPVDVYARPANRFVAGFIGSPAMNFLSGRFRVDGDRVAVALDGGAMWPLAAAPRGVTDGQATTVGMRPCDLRPAGDATPAQHVLSGHVVVVEPLGDASLITVDLGGTDAIATIDGVVRLEPGTTLKLAPRLSQIHLFDPNTGHRLN